MQYKLFPTFLSVYFTYKTALIMNNCKMGCDVVAVKSIQALSSKLLAVRSGSSVVVLSAF